jgi:hypothetical protein
MKHQVEKTRRIFYVCNFHETAAGSRRAFRSSDPPLESKNERVYLYGT